MFEMYEREPFLWAYIKWHYSLGVKELFGTAGNFLWFVSNFFSFKLLLKTLVAPWRRLGEHYDGEFDLGKIASTFVVNSLMRLVGFVTRTFILLLGFISFLAVFMFSFFILAIWVLAPAVLLGSIILSVTLFVI